MRTNSYIFAILISVAAQCPVEFQQHSPAFKRTYLTYPNLLNIKQKQYIPPTCLFSGKYIYKGPRLAQISKIYICYG